MSRRAIRQSLIGAETLFTLDEGLVRERIVFDHPHILVDVVTLDAIDGDVVTPTAGTFTITYQEADDAPFKHVHDGGTISALRCGSDPDMAPMGAGFVGNPLAIRVVPNNVDVALAYRVSIQQNLA